MMHVVVVVVGYRNASDITRCLAALDRSTHAAFEVVICENGGADALATLERSLPRALAGGQPVTLIGAPDNPGYAGGVNIAMRARPDADAWWLLNPDTQADAAALAALVARLGRGDCAAVGGTLHGADGLVQSHGGRWRRWLARAESIGRGARPGDPVNADAVEARLGFVSGASLLAGRRMIDTVGLMRDDYFLYGEEVEWCLRAKAAGLKLGFAPDARVLHGQGGTTGSAEAITRRPRLPIYLDERNKMNVVRDTGAWRLPVAAPAALALLTLRFAMRGAWPQWRAAMAGWAAGLANRRGPPPWMRRDAEG